MQMMNIAGYKFIPLEDRELLRPALLDQCAGLNLKGTILLSTEGININLAGKPAEIGQFKAYLGQDRRFSDMSFRESYSAIQPFNRMKVKFKQEIITMHCPEIRAECMRAPSISPVELKKWLDEKKDIILLDTRNDYEVRFGTFDNALHFQLADFGEFPSIAEKLDKNKPVVMFCTGGVRCEKAGLYFLSQGFSEIYQLEGGILNYFATVGGAHYHGECYVFDQRISLDSHLKETGTKQCGTCQGPITEVQQGVCSGCAKN
jgi:UPF0176 protein